MRQLKYIDLAWGKKQITASVTSSILQGKSIKGLADDAEALQFFHADARDKLQSIVKRHTIKLENGFACFRTTIHCKNMGRK